MLCENKLLVPVTLVECGRVETHSSVARVHVHVLPGADPDLSQITADLSRPGGTPLNPHLRPHQFVNEILFCIYKMFFVPLRHEVESASPWLQPASASLARFCVGPTCKVNANL